MINNMTTSIKSKKQVEKMYKLVDANLISYKEAYVLELKNYKNLSFEGIAKELKLSRQRCHIIYQNASRKLCLPRCQDVLLNKTNNRSADKEPKLDLENAGVPSGVAIKLYNYGIYNIKQLRMYPVDIIASIDGINLIQAKKLINKI